MVRNVVIPIIVALLVIAASLFLFDKFARYASAVQETKLADCTNSVLIIPVRVPKGHAFRVDLRFPRTLPPTNGTLKPPFEFSGRVEVFQRTNSIGAFAIDSNKARLTQAGFVLTGEGSQVTNVARLDQFMEAGKEYVLRITLEPAPPATASVWLNWFVSRNDQ